ncbi:hypothetical protein J0K78_07840 [Halobacillus sp. GSS1]|uniref:hypothetical protein n=1 Tax=Halobacillus sp. GSS1 TaxID=2815919 RepID=UPI001A8DB583|nr:hypothetical protein [Halobacillus sp. GSS1]MBN9654172.1 hypothetical protein [Halobacillus sp. GSS1]
MWINIVIGLVIPWVTIGYLFKKNPVVILLMYPLGVAIAFIGSDWGFGLFWEVTPTYEQNRSLPAFPFKIGYLPLLSVLFGYIKAKEIVKTPLLIILFTIITAFMELVGVWTGKISYFHGWNIFLTLFIYLFGFMGTAFYMKILKKYKILE